MVVKSDALFPAVVILWQTEYYKIELIFKILIIINFKNPKVHSNAQNSNFFKTQLSGEQMDLGGMQGFS